MSAGKKGRENNILLLETANSTKLNLLGLKLRKTIGSLWKASYPTLLTTLMKTGILTAAYKQNILTLIAS